MAKINRIKWKPDDQDVIATIRAIAKRWIERFPASTANTREDLEQEGWMVNEWCKHEFDPHRGSRYVTFLWLNIEWHYKNMIKHERRNQCQSVSIDDAINLCASGSNPERDAMVFEAFEALADASKEFSKLLVDGVPDQLMILAKRHMRAQCLKNGWEAKTRSPKLTKEVMKNYFGFDTSKLSNLVYNRL